LDDLLGVGQDGDEVGLGNWYRVFQLAVEEEGGIGEFFSREAEGGAKEDLGRPAPGEGHPGPSLFGGSGRRYPGGWVKNLCVIVRSGNSLHCYRSLRKLISKRRPSTFCIAPSHTISREVMDFTSPIRAVNALSVYSSR
jgi:hypothetical protein